MAERVVVLMSGGVDSSMAALLLREEGYEVIGVTLGQIPGEWRHKDPSSRWGTGARDAQCVAEQIGIRHEVVDSSELFLKEVIAPFIAAYQSGRTPNPCFRCNPRMKFKTGLELAQRWDAQWVATGHYARVISTFEGPRLAVARDGSKDQSYFLAALPASMLEHIRFPIGELTKAQVRSLAQEHNLPVAQKKESQEICFTVEGDVHSFLTDQEISTDGEIVDTSGEVLGHHKGIVHYTVGQRRGLGLASGPFYVKTLDVRQNRVIVGRHEELFASEVTATEANYLAPVSQGAGGTAKIRSRHRAAACQVKHATEDSFTVRFAEPQWGVAPGQALVLYDGEYVLAGGVIQDWLPARGKR